MICTSLYLWLWRCACGTNQNGTQAEDELVTVAQLAVMMEGQSNLRLVDVRTPAEYEAGHLEGAINIDYKGVDFEKELALLDKARPTVLYCARGGRSHKAYLLGAGMEFEQLYDLEGGYKAWMAAQ